jgi:hypothetical protein
MSNEQAIAERKTCVYLCNMSVTASMGFKDIDTTAEWMQNSEQVVEFLGCTKNLNTRKVLLDV